MPIHGNITHHQDFKLIYLGQHIVLEHQLIPLNLKVGDTFNILKRNEQVIEGTGTVKSIDNNLNQITVDNVVGFTTISNQLYDIRRVIETATSSGIEMSKEMMY